MSRLISIDKLLESDHIPGVKESLENLQTGDLLLFGGSSFWFSKLVRVFSKSQWSHIGMILRDPTYIDPALTGLYLWESGEEDYTDAEDHIKKFGVQINDFTTLLKEGYDGYICYRKLHTDMPKSELENKIKTIHEAVHNKPYDVHLFDFLEASSKVSDVEKIDTPVSRPWSWFKVNHRHNDRYFCSALAGFIYTELGLLPPQTNWTECTPQFFSSEENPTMKLTAGNNLEVDKLLYKNPKK